MSILIAPTLPFSPQLFIPMAKSDPPHGDVESRRATKKRTLTHMPDRWRASRVAESFTTRALHQYCLRFIRLTISVCSKTEICSRCPITGDTKSGMTTASPIGEMSTSPMAPSQAATKCRLLVRDDSISPSRLFQTQQIPTGKPSGVQSAGGVSPWLIGCRNTPLCWTWNIYGH